MSDAPGGLDDRLAALSRSLSAARRAPDVRVSRVVASVRRLARSLACEAERGGSPGLAEEARRLARTTPEALPMGIDGLLDRLARSQVRCQRVPLSSTERDLVLLVDGDPALRRLEHLVLQASHGVILEAASLAEARRLLACASPALIVLEPRLIDGDGRELLLDVQESERLRQTAVIVCTTPQDALLRNECKALGAYAFLEKPFHAHALAACVAEVGERRSALEPSCDDAGL